MPESIAIRRAVRGDAETFLALVDALADYEKLPRPGPEARRRLIDDGFGPRQRYELFLGELGGKTVGYALIFETYSSFLAQPTLYLEDLFVLESARGRGVGAALFNHCRTEAKRRGCGRMEWAVLTWNRPAIDFYERRGSRRLSDWQTYRLTADQLGE